MQSQYHYASVCSVKAGHERLSEIAGMVASIDQVARMPDQKRWRKDLRFFCICCGEKMEAVINGQESPFFRHQKHRDESPCDLNIAAAAARVRLSMRLDRLWKDKILEIRRRHRRRCDRIADFPSCQHHDTLGEGYSVLSGEDIADVRMNRVLPSREDAISADITIMLRDGQSVDLVLPVAGRAVSPARDRVIITLTREALDNLEDFNGILTVDAACDPQALEKLFPDCEPIDPCACAEAQRLRKDREEADRQTKKQEEDARQEAERLAFVARMTATDPATLAGLPALVVGNTEKDRVILKPDGTVATRGEFPKGFSPDGRACTNNGRHVPLSQWYALTMEERYGPEDDFYQRQMRERAPELHERLVREDRERLSKRSG